MGYPKPMAREMMINIIVVCESCHRQRLGDDATGAWVDAPACGYPKGSNISHGCCGPCDDDRYIAAGMVPPSQKENDR